VDSSPTREVSLEVLHRRSAPLQIAGRRLAKGINKERRVHAFEWLVQKFSEEKLPDAQLFSVFGLIDRYFAATPASNMPDSGVLTMAAMIITLKEAGTPEDLQRGKQLVVKTSCDPKPWIGIHHAELRILRRLSYRVCTPTAYDILDRLLGKSRVDFDELWDDSSHLKCANLARFLLELAVLHEPDAVYGSGYPPLVAALGAMFLAYLAVRAPHQCIMSLLEPLSLLEKAEHAIMKLVHVMRSRWVVESEKSLEGTARSIVMNKWLQRMGVGGVGASPPDTSEFTQLCFLIAELTGSKPYIHTKNQRLHLPTITAFGLMFVHWWPSSKIRQKSKSSWPQSKEWCDVQRRPCVIRSRSCSANRCSFWELPLQWMAGINQSN